MPESLLIMDTNGYSSIRFKVWLTSDSRGIRLSRLCKHLLRDHFSEEIRVTVVNLVGKVQRTQKCPQCQVKTSPYK